VIFETSCSRSGKQNWKPAKALISIIVVDGHNPGIMKTPQLDGATFVINVGIENTWQKTALYHWEISMSN
jgi:hypothetical protein